MKSYISLFIISIFLLSGCTKEDFGYRTPDLEIPVVTGYYMTTGPNDPVNTIGTPNVRLYDGSNISESKYILSCYPNPIIGYCNIIVQTPQSQSLKKVWITYARADDELLSSFVVLNMTNMYAGGSPLFQGEFTSDNIIIDLSEFNDGFYRIYVKVDDQLLYDNLLVSENYINE